MDLFFKKETSTLGIEELHVIGVVCMMIASKYEDIKPLSMNTIYYQIGHERLPRCYLVNVEKIILKVIEYRLCIPTILDFLEPLLKNSSECIKSTAVLIAELAQLNAGLSWINSSSLAQAIYLLANSSMIADVTIPENILFIMHTIKQFLLEFSYPHQSSFIKHSATLSPNSGIWFKFANLMQED